MNDVPIRDFRIERYALKLSTAWRSAHGALHLREGEVLILEDQTGGLGVGECAPMPAAGTESADAARAGLRERANALIGNGVVSGLAQSATSAAGSETGRMLPAASCAIDSALLDLRAMRTGVPLRQLLNPDAVDEFAVNASLGAIDATIRERAQAAASAGFRVLKIKLGVSAPELEQAALRKLVAVLPADCRLRLDANGAWDEACARGWLTMLQDLPVECLEEPLKGAASDRLRALQAGCQFPLAADESLPRLLTSSAPGQLPVRRAVLKPTVLGGARRSMALAKDLMSHGIECVVTTTVEAAPGRWLVAHCAAALGNDLAHGLDTGDWLASDLGLGPAVIAGRCRLPLQPGLGFRFT